MWLFAFMVGNVAGFSPPRATGCHDRPLERDGPQERVYPIHTAKRFSMRPITCPKRLRLAQSEHRQATYASGHDPSCGVGVS